MTSLHWPSHWCTSFVTPPLNRASSYRTQPRENEFGIPGLRVLRQFTPSVTLEPRAEQINRVSCRVWLCQFVRDRAFVLVAVFHMLRSGQRTQLLGTRDRPDSLRRAQHRKSRPCDAQHEQLPHQKMYRFVQWRRLAGRPKGLHYFSRYYFSRYAVSFEQTTMLPNESNARPMRLGPASTSSGEPSREMR